MLSKLYERSLYLNPNIDFLFGRNIIEFDMKSAGLSLIKYYNLLDEHTIASLEQMEKTARNKQIGIIQRDNPEFKNSLSNAFIDMRRIFIETLNLNDIDILSIKKDAIFIIDPPTKKEVCFKNVIFVPKNKYTSYINLNKKEFYINSLMKQIDVKGLSSVELHRKYLLDFILKFATMNEKSSNVDIIIRTLVRFVKDYRNRKLPVEFYREMNNSGMYRVYQDYLDDFVEISNTDDIDNLDISYNYINYIAPLASIYL